MQNKLKEYKRKRNFNITTEPDGESVKPAKTSKTRSKTTDKNAEKTSQNQQKRR